MIFQDKTSMPHYQFSLFAKEKTIKHFVSTRKGGISEGSYQHLNLGLHTQDGQDNIIENRKRLAQSLMIPLPNFCFAEQVHGSTVKIIRTQGKSAGTTNYSSAIAQTDAMICEEKGICLTVLGADCALLLFYDKKQQKIGACHAGWRGAVQKIAQKTAQAMHDSFGSAYENILVGISPCISAQVYEVGQEVTEAVEQAFGTKENYLLWQKGKQRFHFDLVYANIQQLLDLGLQAKNIEQSLFCTYLNNDLFFSARKDKGITGRFGAGIMLSE